jgi:ribosome maturation factor RimP
MKQTKIEQLIEPLIIELGYELWGCEYLASGKHSILRIFIDREQGITLDDCELVSHQVSTLLDVEEPISSNYSLEISSPGLERILFKPTQYSRYLGEKVFIKLSRPYESRRKLKGLLKRVDEDYIVVTSEEGEYKILFSDIIRANLIV